MLRYEFNEISGKLGNCLAKCKKVLDYLFCTFALLPETERTTTATATVRKWWSRNAKVFNRLASSAFLSLSTYQTGRTASGVAREALRDQVCVTSVLQPALWWKPTSRRAEQSSGEVDCDIVESGFVRVAVCWSCQLLLCIYMQLILLRNTNIAATGRSGMQAQLLLDRIVSLA